MKYIATWYYEQNSTEGGDYAQAAGDPGSEPFRDIYRRCIAVFFASSRAANPDASLVLFVNVEPRGSTVIARTMIEVVRVLDVKVVLLDYKSAPPEGWTKAWRNQFFVFDCLRHLAYTMEPDDAVVLLDSDVVWTGRAVDQFWTHVYQNGCVRYDLGFAPEEVQNGLNSYELAGLARDAIGFDAVGVAYAGGEMQAATTSSVKVLSKTADQVWDGIRERWISRPDFSCEETHVLSIVYAIVGAANTQHLIKRCWTQRVTHRNLDGTERQLSLWHAPAEKQFGFLRLYQRLASVGAQRWAAWNSEYLYDLLSKELGVPRDSPRKQFRDALLRLQRVVVRP